MLMWLCATMAGRVAIGTMVLKQCEGLIGIDNGLLNMRPRCDEYVTTPGPRERRSYSVDAKCGLATVVKFMPIIFSWRTMVRMFYVSCGILALLRHSKRTSHMRGY